MNIDSRGTMVQRGDFMRIDNAFVEEVSCSNNSNGNILVSYSMPERNNMNSIQTIRLNLNRHTTILNSFGHRTCLCCIQPGMWVNVVFSLFMTKSIPPQSNAFFVHIQKRPCSTSSVSTGRIILVDYDNLFLITEALNSINNQTKFIVTATTTITNRFGASITFNALQPGQTVKITHANFQTASIPPQTTAFNIQLL